MHGCQLDESQALVTMSDVTDSPGIAADIFEGVAAEEILVDMIIQGVGEDGRTTVSFTVPAADLERAHGVVAAIADRAGATVSAAPRVAILSVTGVGIRSHTGVGTRMFGALSEAGINVELISTSEVKVNVVVAKESGVRGLKVLEEAFADVVG